MNGDAIPLLFAGTPLNHVLSQQLEQLKREIQDYKVDYLLRVDEQELFETLLAKYRLEVPALLEDTLTALPIEDRLQQGFAGNIRVIRYTISVAFTGDPELFGFQPSHFTFNPPQGNVKGHELLLYFSLPEGSKDLKSSIDKEVESIHAYLGWVQRDIDRFNDPLKTRIKELVSERKRRLELGEAVLKDLGIPIRSRANLPDVYKDLSKREVVEIRHRDVKIREALPKEEPFVPLEGYEHILKVIFSLSLGMERSPAFFSKQGEEQLRDFILMFLNVYFEGQATGETFNKSGKTDILIRVDNNNVFVAECKFWAGKKKLTKAIDQLFDYVTWRDTKTAIVIFNKNENFTSVLQQIESIMESHTCYVSPRGAKRNEFRDETVFRYSFHHPDDEDREILLTVLCFNIETPRRGT